MPKVRSGQSVPLLGEPPMPGGRPLYHRLYLRIRQAVLDGAMPPGTRLASARNLASDEGVSRNTVEAAFRQLEAEGFVTRRVGAGSWISDRLPERPRGAGLLPVRPSKRVRQSAPQLSAGGRRLVGAGADVATPPELVFAPGGAGLEALPLDAWNRIAARLTRRASSELLTPPPAAGLPSLRQAVATYLRIARGVRCDAENVIIVNSTQQSIDLAARLLLDPGDEVWVEDPGYLSARLRFQGAGARLVPVPVDGEGMDVSAGIARALNARLAYVTPSHQYPLGVTLSLERRLALIDWAERVGSWILEDDYDSELRHLGRPLMSLQGIDGAGRVLYAGTFNKVLFPTLRIGYIVLPSRLADAFAQARQLTDGFTPPLPQRALAEFIEEGHFSIHLRKLRELLRERRDRFVEAARDLPSHAEIGPSAAGLHVALRLPAATDDKAISARARTLGIAVPALSSHAIEHKVRGLVVHYGNATLTEIGVGVSRLRDVLSSTASHRRR